ncbi:MAG TPA: hypothetical protein VMH86_07865 [Rhizomicrobium sp.]|nr:hypothetical protein [Rhizomicrobium sp.]
MTRLARTLIATTALTILPLSLAYAGGSSESNILNGQVDFHTAQSTLNVDTSNVAGNVAQQSVAGGNAVDITTMNNTEVTNNQYVSSVDVSSHMNANVTNTGGTVSLSSQAVCNSAGVSMDPTSTNVYSNQECNAVDPSSTLNASVYNAGNDVSLASAAIGNSFEEDTNAKHGAVQNYQINNSNVSSAVNGSVVNVNGNVTATSAAIGNTAQIVHY